MFDGQEVGAEVTVGAKLGADVTVGAKLGGEVGVAVGADVTVSVKLGSEVGVAVGAKLGAEELDVRESWPWCDCMSAFGFPVKSGDTDRPCKRLKGGKR